jgi:outer membrane protein TolC
MAWGSAGPPFWIVISMILAGCAVGPDYQRVDPSVPARFGALEPGTTVGDPLPPGTGEGWWTIFQDPELDRLLARAVEKNHDLRLAGSRVRLARALRGGAVGGGQRDGDLYNAAFDASWEIDIFGAVRREVEAADADWAASRESWRDTLISLRGEVGRNYIEVRAIQLRLRIAWKDAVMRGENVGLSEARYQAGLIAEQELARNRGALANAQSVIPTLEKNWSAAVHRLGVLLGEAPSELIRELAAATARIGVAQADLFPRFSLTGAFGLQSRNTGNLADEGSSFWRIGPTFRWNILNLQRIFSNIAAGEVVREGALVQYEKAVLMALEEVQNALGLVALYKALGGGWQESGSAADAGE